MPQDRNNNLNTHTQGSQIDHKFDSASKMHVNCMLIDHFLTCFNDVGLQRM